MSRILTIVRGHVRSWFRSRSTIFWTLLFPILLIVLFGAIFGNGNTKFDLYVQNQDLVTNAQTPASLGFVTALNQTGAFNLHTVPVETVNPLSYVRDDAQLNNRGQRLVIIPVGFQQNLTQTQKASIQLYLDQSDQASGPLSGVINAVSTQYAARFSNSTASVSVQQVPIIAHSTRYIDFFIPGVIGMTLLNSGIFGAVETNGRYRDLKII
ncbi:MAG TPA: ABC transporter permease, partial [Candidatus Dormibacteraeota bacterium]|nr:ABC transporter permease [Candidatus Dormibacteraeota bacterium]